MTTRRIILDSRLISLLMGSVWFNCNRVFSGFEFIFSNPRRVGADSGIVTLVLPRLYF